MQHLHTQNSQTIKFDIEHRPNKKDSRSERGFFLFRQNRTFEFFSRTHDEHLSLIWWRSKSLFIPKFLKFIVKQQGMQFGQEKINKKFTKLFTCDVKIFRVGQVRTCSTSVSHILKFYNNYFTNNSTYKCTKAMALHMSPDTLLGTSDL